MPELTWGVPAVRVFESQSRARATGSDHCDQAGCRGDNVIIKCVTVGPKRLYILELCYPKQASCGSTAALKHGRGYHNGGMRRYSQEAAVKSWRVRVANTCHTAMAPIEGFWVVDPVASSTMW